MDPTASECDTPKRGRPRSAEVDEAVLAATIEVAGEVGVTRLSMDEVAERAGVSKASIYRRWPSKEAMVLDALRSRISTLDDVDTGSLVGDLHRYLGELANRVQSGRLSDVVPHLIEVACHDEAVRESLDEYVESRRQPMRRILDRARARGELSKSADIDTLIDVLVAPFFYRHLMRNTSVDKAFVKRLVAIVIGSPTS